MAGIDAFTSTFDPRDTVASRWITVQRFAPEMRWPVCELKITENTADSGNFKTLIGLASWREDQIANSPMVIRDNLPGLQSVRFVEGVANSSDLKYMPTRARVGEVDILVVQDYGRDVPYQIAHELGSALCAFTRGHIAVHMEEFGKDVGPVDTFAPAWTTRVTPHFDVGVQKVRDLSNDEVLAQLGSIAKSLNPYTHQQRTAIGAAARRLVMASNRADPIDRFIDLWLACEFLCCKPTWPAPKNGAYAIGDQISRHTGLDKTDARRRTKQLFEIRGAIIHSALTDPSRVDVQLNLLDAFARTLLDHRYGKSYDNAVHEVLKGNLLPGRGMRFKVTFGPPTPPTRE